MSQCDSSFEHPQHLLKLMGKKIFTILHYKFCLSKPIDVTVYPRIHFHKLMTLSNQWLHYICKCILMRFVLIDTSIWVRSHFKTCTYRCLVGLEVLFLLAPSSASIHYACEHGETAQNVLAHLSLQSWPICEDPDLLCCPKIEIYILPFTSRKHLLCLILQIEQAQIRQLL